METLNLPASAERNPFRALVTLDLHEPRAKYFEALRDRGFKDDAAKFRNSYMQFTGVWPEEREAAKIELTKRAAASENAGHLAQRDVNVSDEAAFEFDL